ncbi:MAG TPA: hypothetical protein VKV57_02340 [bacterium]|nr:hypothetical protein [bacterium]
MESPWLVFATIAGPIAAVILSAIIVNLLELRPRLFTWYEQITSVTLRPPDKSVIPVNTHAFTVRNVGRRPAHNVSVSHFSLPDYNVVPPVPHERKDLPQGGVSLIFPTLAPKEQVTITYIYFPPVTWSLINAGVRSDEAVAQPITVLPTRQFAPWVYRTFAALFYMGVFLAAYLLVRFGIWVSTIKHA